MFSFLSACRVPDVLTAPRVDLVQRQVKERVKIPITPLRAYPPKAMYWVTVFASAMCLAWTGVLVSQPPSLFVCSAYLVITRRMQRPRELEVEAEAAAFIRTFQGKDFSTTHLWERVADLLGVTVPDVK